MLEQSYLTCLIDKAIIITICQLANSPKSIDICYRIILKQNIFPFKKPEAANCEVLKLIIHLIIDSAIKISKLKDIPFPMKMYREKG